VDWALHFSIGLSGPKTGGFVDFSRLDERRQLSRDFNNLAL